MRRVYIEFQMWPSYLAMSVCCLSERISDSCSGSGSPARTHDHLHIAYQIPPTITCSAIYPVTKSATYMSSMSIGRIYVTTRSEDSR